MGDMGEWIDALCDVPNVINGSGVQVLAAVKLDSGGLMHDVRWYWLSRGFDDSSVTHWMPLPDLPKT